MGEGECGRYRLAVRSSTMHEFAVWAPKSKKVAGRGGVAAASTGGKAPATPGKKVKIQCPNCQEIMTITDPKRPLTVDCKGCGKKLVLSK